jgi:amino acid adenylation domain-containing protein
LQQGVTSPNANFARMLWDTAARVPASPALIERDSRVSYGELLSRASAVARLLVAEGLQPSQRVGILLERGADAAAALFGVWCAGGTAVFVDDVLRPKQIEHVLSHSEASLLLTTRPALERQPRPLDIAVPILEVPAPGRDDRMKPALRTGGNIAQIVYTSGSTGLPKGVMISHDNLASLTAVVNGYLGISSSDRVASLLPFSFVYGLGQLLCSVRVGATLVVERSPLASQIVATLREKGVTVAAGVPSLWAMLMDAPEFESELGALRVMTNAGGALPAARVHKLRERQPRAKLFLMYGLTEALRCTYLSPDEVDAHPDSIGRAIPGADVWVLGDDGTPVGVGETGELVFRGPTVTLGYWRDPVATERVFTRGPFGAMHGEHARVVHTGDLVRRDESGLLYFVGRKDRMIKTMGYRVSPNDLVAALHASGQVTDAAVTGEPDDRWGMVLVAHVVLEPHGSLERLNEYCATELPRYLRPARILVRDEIPLTPNGKHDVAALSG